MGWQLGPGCVDSLPVGLVERIQGSALFHSHEGGESRLYFFLLVDVLIKSSRGLPMCGSVPSKDFGAVLQRGYGFEDRDPSAEDEG